MRKKPPQSLQLRSHRRGELEAHNSWGIGGPVVVLTTADWRGGEHGIIPITSQNCGGQCLFSEGMNLNNQLVVLVCLKACFSYHNFS